MGDGVERQPIIGKGRSSNAFKIIAVSILVIGIICLVVGSVLYSKEQKNDSTAESDSVGVVVDAGGSGTRLVVYVYKGNGQLSQLKYMKCEREGLAKYTEQQFPQLRELLKSCFSQGAQSLPAGKKVPVYFAATAGMRLLKLRDPDMYQKIWGVVKDCIRSSEFKMMTSRTITGFEEAKWGWVAANYLKHSLNANHTYGTIDFGSSSLQLTFETEGKKAKSKDIQTVLIDGHNTTIYGHSYLCFGAVEMVRRMNAKVVKDSGYKSEVENPCYGVGYSENMTSGYLSAAPCSSGEYARTVLGEELSGPANKTYLVKGSGNFSQCHAVVTKLLDRNCSSPPCGMNNMFQPAFNNKDIRFLALSTFYYLSKALQLPPSSNKNTFREAARNFCARTYDAKTAQKYTHWRCFQGSYGYYMLQSFGFPTDWNIEFVKKIDGTGVSWALGLMYMKKSEMFVRAMISSSNPVFIVLVVVGVAAIAGAIIFFFVYRKRSVKV